MAVDLKAYERQGWSRSIPTRRGQAITCTLIRLYGLAKRLARRAIVHLQASGCLEIFSMVS